MKDDFNKLLPTDEELKHDLAVPDVNLQESWPDTGWRCAVCFTYAQVHMIDVTLCVPHAKRYNFGYGDRLADMREEFDGTKRKI